MLSAIKRAATIPDLERVILKVVTNQASARDPICLWRSGLSAAHVKH